MAISKAPFSDLRVLDFSRVLAGPLCGQYFADLGADVIKVEPPTGDENRRWEPIIDGASASFMNINRGKRGLTLNLKTESGQSILRQLIADADVVIDSYLPADADVLGFSHAHIMDMNPEIVHVSVSAYGATGPMQDDPGYDLLLQAFTGIMQLTGESSGPPNRAGVSVVDLATGMIAFGAATSALYARACGHKGGEHVQVSLLQTGMALMAPHVANLAFSGVEAQRQGSGLWSLVPYQAFAASDGWILIGVTNDAAWLRFCNAVSLNDLGDNPSYSTALGRIEHRDEIVSTVQALISTRSVEDWLKLLQPARIPSARVNTVRETLAEEQVRAVDILLEVVDSEGKARELVGRPMTFASGYEPARASAPHLGQHNAEILGEIGITRQEIEELREAEVI